MRIVLSASLGLSLLVPAVALAEPTTKTAQGTEQPSGAERKICTTRVSTGTRLGAKKTCRTVSQARREQEIMQREMEDMQRQSNLGNRR